MTYDQLMQQVHIQRSYFIRKYRLQPDQVILNEYDFRAVENEMNYRFFNPVNHDHVMRVMGMKIFRSFDQPEGEVNVCCKEPKHR